MSDFDAAAGIDQDSMNAASANIYQHIYPGIFVGNTTVDGLPLSWDVQQAPTFDLTNVADMRQKIVNHLQIHNTKPPADISHDEAADLMVGALGGSSFKLNFPKVALSSGGTVVEAAFVVDCAINTSGGVLTLQAINTSFLPPEPSGWDKLVLTAILGQMQTIANDMLSGVKIPQITFDGVSLTPPTVSVQQSRVVVFFNLAGKPQPLGVSLQWPSAPFFLMLSDDAKNAIAMAGTRAVTQNFHSSGSVGSSIGGASYNANATLSDLSLSSVGSGTRDFNFSANISGGVDAHVTFLCVPVGVNYNLYAKPNPSGAVRISLSGTNMTATTLSVSSFVIVIEPSGSIIEKVISAITYPILQAVSAAFSPLISSFLGEISFGIGTIPSIPISVSGYNITLSPSNMSLTSSNGYMTAVGQMTIS